MDQVTLVSVGRFFEEALCSQGFLGLVVFLAFLEEEAFLGVFHQDRSNRHRPDALAAAYSAEQLETYFLVVGSRDTIVKAQVISTSSGFAGCPSVGTLETWRETSMLDRPVA